MGRSALLLRWQQASVILPAGRASRLTVRRGTDCDPEVVGHDPL